MSNIIPFHFGEQEVRVYVDNNGDPWWEAQNVCGVLGIHDVSKAVARLRPREKRSESRNLLIINESGLYRLIMRSNKPEAERFQDWVFGEVLPALRKTGKYEVASPLDRHPDLKAITELALGVAQARDMAEAAQNAAERAQIQAVEAQAHARQADAKADRAMETQLFFTIAEYIYINKLQRKVPESAYQGCSEHLRAYCMDHRIPFRKIAVGGKAWKDEYAFHQSVYAEAFERWLKRFYAQGTLEVVPKPRTQGD